MDGAKRKQQEKERNPEHWPDREEGDKLTIFCAIHFPND